jgi:hypothetical protein
LTRTVTRFLDFRPFKRIASNGRLLRRLEQLRPGTPVSAQFVAIVLPEPGASPAAWVGAQNRAFESNCHRFGAAANRQRHSMPRSIMERIGA